MTLTASAGNISTSDTVIVALLGYGVVFLGLIALMAVVILLGKAFSGKKKAAPAAAPAPVAVEEVPSAPAAPGAAGELKLHDVEPKTAAMLMAIVANKLNKPLNELRFTSIREVK